MAYTLVRNPSLIPMTGSNLEATNAMAKLRDQEFKSAVDSNCEKVELEKVEIHLPMGDLDTKQDKHIRSNV